MTMFISIMGPLPTNGGGGAKIGGRRKRLEIGGDRFYKTRPSRGRGQFYDKIEF